MSYFLCIFLWMWKQQKKGMKENSGMSSVWRKDDCNRDMNAKVDNEGVDEVVSRWKKNSDCLMVTCVERELLESTCLKLKTTHKYVQKRGDAHCEQKGW